MLGTDTAEQQHALFGLEMREDDARNEEGLKPITREMPAKKLVTSTDTKRGAPLKKKV
jgi:hypothetical protein